MLAAVCTVALAFCSSALDDGALAAAKAGFPQAALWVVERTVLYGDIAHYRFDMPVGPGKYDVIRVHRVVRELQPNQPMRTADAVMFLPGEPTYFETLYIPPLISQVPARDRSIAIFLAKNDIDVWGMDYGWALVPEGTTDLRFMKEWRVMKDVEHVQSALSIARWTRGSFRQRVDPLYVIGLSYGGDLAYAVAAADAQQPSSRRIVKGIIPLEGLVKWEESVRAWSCSVDANTQAMLDAGTYADDSGLFMKQLAELALSAPDGKPSLIDPNLTNYQAALLVGTSALDPASWHFVGSYLDVNGIPTDLRFTEARLWLDLIRAMPPYGPLGLGPDNPWCGKLHLSEITVPILYVGGAGGIGKCGYYTTTLTGSKDVTKVLVQLLSDDQRMMDFGNGDLVFAKNAETLVWKPILDWIKAHR
jgi:pimeloyl-ACP methyl ester carboxylesterase